MEHLDRPKTLVLTGNVADNWRRFRQCWECYVTVVCEGKRRSALYKSSLFLGVVGEDGRELYNTFEWEEEDDDKDLDKILEKFEKYCVPKKNITYERYKFFTCNQKDEENIDQYQAELRNKARSCEFGTLVDGLIRDRIVCGIVNLSVRERLLREGDLSLTRAVDICRAGEVAKQHANELGPSRSEMNVDALKARKHRNSGYSQASNQGNHNKSEYNDPGGACNRCGRNHKPRQCPAWGQTCYNCSAVGHFSRLCRKPRQGRQGTQPGNSRRGNVNELHASESCDPVSTSTESDFFVDSLNADSQTGEYEWTLPVEIEDSVVVLKLDTGANINILNYDDWRKVSRKGLKMQPSDVKLTAYLGEQVPISGQAVLNVVCKGQAYQSTFVITPERRQSILGVQDCERFNLVHRVYAVNADVTGSSQKVLDVFETYKDVFTGLGCLPGQQSIVVDTNIAPVVEPCRKVPFALHDDLKKELDRMQTLNVIREVTEPTEWVSSLVVVHKKSGKLRVCLDPQNLNRAIQREHFKLPTRDEIMAQFAGATVFSKLDASSGFWQLQLDEKSSMLTTFNTPFGRYRYLRLPFGISSAPEIYHRTIHQLFENLPGVDTSMDDMIIWGSSVEEHDSRLTSVLEKCRSVGLKLNREKCELRVTELTFLGDRVSIDGLKPDPVKVKAIVDMAKPTEKKELQRFLGMVNFLGKYIKDLSTVSAPLRRLLEKSSQWEWKHEHDRAWEDLKTRISSEPVLQFYDQRKPLKVASDASQYGLGAVLLQKEENNSWLPVAYASRAMTDAESRYAQIEKEALSICFAMEKFHQFIYGRRVVAETDHKPLVSIFVKGLNDCPPRIQRFRLRLQKYDLLVTYKPGREMHTADALSRNFPQAEAHSSLEEDVKVFVDSIVASLPVSEGRFSEIRNATARDPVLQRLTSMVLAGWPDNRINCSKELLEFWNYRDELSVIDGVVFKSSRVVIPAVLRAVMLEKIHAGHLGQEKCKQRAREVLFWPGMNGDIVRLVQQCEACCAYRHRQQSEPLLPPPVAVRPWQKVATDLFEFEKAHYIVIVDYYSNYPEVVKLSSQSSQAVINVMKATFARHGIPEEVMSDNGPCYAGSEFAQFAKDWGFLHTTSSPRYPQSNGLAERTVQTIKNIMRKCSVGGEDPHIGLLAYRSSPLDNGFTPAHLLMGRRIQCNLPVDNSLLRPKTTPTQVLNKMVLLKERQKCYHDKKASAESLPPLQNGDAVRVWHDNNWKMKGDVVDKVAPRSYRVKSDAGSIIRRNRRDLVPESRLEVARPPQSLEPPTELSETVPPPQIARPTRLVRRPTRLIEET